jgi:YesN/AraC family two-component response regulator
MPHMNGLEMIKKLKEQGKNIPTIVMSAHTEEEYIQKAKEYGVDKYLLKPFDFINFIDIIVDMKIK